MCGLSPQQYLDNVPTQMLDFLRSGSMQMARCCNHRCHKQGQTGSQHLSLALSLLLSHTLSLWHKMICHSEQESALQGGRWHPFISTGLIQNIVSPSGRKQIKQTGGQMEREGRKEGKREDEREKKKDEKTVILLLPSSSIR